MKSKYLSIVLMILIFLIFILLTDPYIRCFVDRYEKFFYMAVTSILTVGGAFTIATYNAELASKKELRIILADIFSYLSKVQTSFKLVNYNNANHYFFGRLHALTNVPHYRTRAENLLTRANSLGETFENQRSELERLIILYTINSKNVDMSFIETHMAEFKASLNEMFQNSFDDVLSKEELFEKYKTLPTEVFRLSEETTFFKSVKALTEHFKSVIKNRIY